MNFTPIMRLGSIYLAAPQGSNFMGRNEVKLDIFGEKITLQFRVLFLDIPEMYGQKNVVSPKISDPPAVNYGYILKLLVQQTIRSETNQYSRPMQFTDYSPPNREHVMESYIFEPTVIACVHTAIEYHIGCAGILM